MSRDVSSIVTGVAERRVRAISLMMAFLTTFEALDDWLRAPSTSICFTSLLSRTKGTTRRIPLGFWARSCLHNSSFFAQYPPDAWPQSRPPWCPQSPPPCHPQSPPPWSIALRLFACQSGRFGGRRSITTSANDRWSHFRSRTLQSRRADPPKRRISSPLAGNPRSGEREPFLTQN